MCPLLCSNKNSFNSELTKPMAANDSNSCACLDTGTAVAVEVMTEVETVLVTVSETGDEAVELVEVTVLATGEAVKFVSSVSGKDTPVEIAEDAATLDLQHEPTQICVAATVGGEAELVTAAEDEAATEIRQHGPLQGTLQDIEMTEGIGACVGLQQAAVHENDGGTTVGRNWGCTTAAAGTGIVEGEGEAVVVLIAQASSVGRGIEAAGVLCLASETCCSTTNNFKAIKPAALDTSNASFNSISEEMVIISSSSSL